MSSIIEKILIIGVGAIICLNLFSTISPVFEQINSEMPNQDPNNDIVEFYKFIKEVEQSEKIVQNSPGQVIELNYSFTIADSLFFSKNDNFTLTIQLSIEDKQISEAIVFQSYMKLFENKNNQEKEVDFTLKSKGDADQIQITLDIICVNNMIELHLMN